MPEVDGREPTPAVKLFLQWARAQRRYLTPADLARIVGVTRATITNWFNKGGEPSIEMLTKIADGTSAYNQRNPPDFGPDYPFPSGGIPFEDLLHAQGIVLPNVEEMWQIVEATIRQTGDLTESDRAKLLAEMRAARRDLTARKLQDTMPDHNQHQSESRAVS